MIGNSDLLLTLEAILDLEKGPIVGEEVLHRCTANGPTGQKCCRDRAACVDRAVHCYAQLFFGKSWPIPATSRFTNVKINADLVTCGYLLHGVLASMIVPKQGEDDLKVAFDEVGVGMSDYQFVQGARKTRL